MPPATNWTGAPFSAARIIAAESTCPASSEPAPSCWTRLAAVLMYTTSGATRSSAKSPLLWAISSGQASAVLLTRADRSVSGWLGAAPAVDALPG